MSISPVINLQDIAKPVALLQRDFGTEIERRTIPIRSPFQLTNTTPSPLTITELRPSCGCTAAIIEGANASLPLTLAPGASVSIRVTIDTFHLTPGKIDKTVAVYAKGYDKPYAVLEVTGTILPTVTFSKPVMEFGSVDAGASRSVALDVIYDRTLDTADAHVELVSADPDVAVEPMGQAVAVDENKPVISGTHIVPENRRTYTVTFAPGEHIGNLTGRIEAVLRTGSDPKKDVVLGDVPVNGRVIGEVAAMPEAIAFGTVEQGRPGTQQIVLSGADLSGLTVASSNAFVNARLGAVVDAAKLNRPFGVDLQQGTALSAQNDSKKAKLLIVMLAANTPAGAVQSSVSVTTAHHQVLRLPVYAFVEKPR